MTIETVMERYSITKKDLARDLGIPYRTVQHWCKRDRMPPPYLPKLLYEYYRQKSLDKNVKEE